MDVTHRIIAHRSDSDAILTLILVCFRWKKTRRVQNVFLPDFSYLFTKNAVINWSDAYI